MSDPINPKIASGLEKLATDLLVDRHGDPHLAFVVLLYPDDIGRVLCVGYDDHPPIDMAKLRFHDEDDPAPREATSAKLPIEELHNASRAIDDLEMAIRVTNQRRPGTKAEQIAEFMRGQRERRFSYAIKTDFARAEELKLHPAPCQFCGQRFTTRGVGRHERSCYKNPDAPMYGPGGDYIATLKNGKVTGYSMRHRSAEETVQCARCPEPRYRHPDDGPCAGSKAGGGCTCKRFVAAAAIESEAQ